MAEEDPEVAALRARLDQELSKPPPKNDVSNVVAGTAVKTVISIIISVLIAAWLLKSCFAGIGAGWH